ncbi:MAG: DUF1959 domain-containing protein [Methanolinea sp.]|nr:DUF1959 domain-containing protein [Methanolinea sp.]
MKEVLFEKDLSAVKYHILESARHDRVVREIASDLGIPHLRLRRILMERLDMILLENLPARYEEGKRVDREAGGIEGALSAHLYTRAVPIVPPRAMAEIVEGTKALAASGVPPAEAVARGKALVREAVLG